MDINTKELLNIFSKDFGVDLYIKNTKVLGKVRKLDSYSIETSKKFRDEIWNIVKKLQISFSRNMYLAMVYVVCSILGYVKPFVKDEFLKIIDKEYIKTERYSQKFIEGLNQTITITFGDQAENHRGMEIIGERADEGFNLKDFVKAKAKFEKLLGPETEARVKIIHLNDYLPKEIEGDDAYLMIIRGGLDLILNETGFNTDTFYKEQLGLEWDTQAFMYGRVVNKKARYNLCYNKEGQDPDYECKKGRVIAYKDIPSLEKTKELLEKFFGSKAENLVAEGNYYYDLEKTFIFYHGDSERKKVIGVRLGSTFPLYFRWHLRSEPIGELFRTELHHGDVYLMSEKTVGYDWKVRNIPTLRHAAFKNPPK